MWGSWPSARHDKAQWLALGATCCCSKCGATVLGTKPCWASKGVDAQGNLLGSAKAVGSGIPWTGASTARGTEDVPKPRNGAAGAPDRARDQCQPSVLFVWVFGRAHLHRCVALDGLGHDAGRDWQSVFRSGHKLFSISCVVCLTLCVCVFVCAPRAYPVVFRLPCKPWAFPRNRRPAGLLGCGTESNFTARRSTRNPSCRVRRGR